MTQKWTEGPWVVDGDGDNIEVLAITVNGHLHHAMTISNQIPIGDYAGSGVATVVWPVEDDRLELRKELIANADLIAAAPELYEALEKAIKVIDEDEHCQEGDRSEEIALYSAILAKARGEVEEE